MFKLPRGARAVMRALDFTWPETTSLLLLTTGDWSELLSSHEFVPLTLPLVDLFPDRMPGWVRARLARFLLDNTARLERMKTLYSEIALALRQVHADHVLIKGFAQWPGFTDHPRFHSQSDIDLYCPPDSLERARDAVVSLGYEPDPDQRHRRADHLPALVRLGGWYWKGNYFDPEMPPAVELHHCLWDRAAFRFGPSLDEAFWRRRIERNLDGLRFPALALPDNLGHSALQLLKDGFEDAMSPARLYELGRFLDARREDETFWRAWTDTHEPELRKLEAVLFLAAQAAFGPRLAEPAEREVRSLDASVKTWFRRFAHRIFDRRPERPNTGIWLWLTLLESARDRPKVLWASSLPRRPVCFPAFAERERILRGPAHPTRSRATRLRYLQHIQRRVVARTKAAVPSFVQGLGFWWSTKNFSADYGRFYRASFLYDLGLLIFFVLYNLLLLDRGFDARFIGLVTGAGALGSVAGTILGGLCAQRYGLRPMLLLCFPLLALVSALRVAVSIPSLLISLAFLGGALMALFALSLSPAVAQMTDERNRSLGFSLILSTGIAVGTVGGFLGGHLPGWLALAGARSALSSKQWALWVASGIVALALWPASRLRFPTMPASGSWSFPRSRFLWRFIAAVAVWSLVTGGFSPFFNAYFSQQFHMPVTRIGTMFSLSQLMQVLAVLLAPWLFREVGLVRGVRTTQVATAVALACLAEAPTALVAGLLYTLFSALEWMNEPGIFTLLMEGVAPHERTTASAMMFLAISVSQSAAGALAGAGFARFGYPPVMRAVALAGVLAALLFGRLRRDLAVQGAQREESVAA